MNYENSYEYIYQQPTNIGPNFPRVSSRVAFQNPAFVANRGAMTRDMNRLHGPEGAVEINNYPAQVVQRYPEGWDPIAAMKARESAMPHLRQSNQIIYEDQPHLTQEMQTQPAFQSLGTLLGVEDEVGNERGSVRLQHIETRGEADKAYPQVYRDVPFFQLPQENLITNPVPFYLTVDSRDRDRRVWANSNEFRIPLVTSSQDLNVKAPNVRYKNIYSIGLLSCVVPNRGNVLAEPYLLLQIDEIDNVYDSANPPSAKAFTKLYFTEPCAGSSYLRLDKGVGDPLTKVYWPAPRSSLDQVTISFRRYDGSLFDFGADDPLPDPPLEDRQTSITLEIRNFVVDTGKAIGHRNV